MKVFQQPPPSALLQRQSSQQQYQSQHSAAMVMEQANHRPPPPPRFPTQALLQLNPPNNTTIAAISADQLPSTVMMTSIATARWRSLVDNCVIELLASLFLNMTTLFCWNSEHDTNIMLIPGMVMGLIMLCLKDEDYFFPDGSPLVTLVLWVLGGYSWLHVVARLIGQCLGFALAVWICNHAVLPNLACQSIHATPMLVFTLEAIGTILEHMAIVYVVMPLLPPAHHPTQVSEGLALIFPKVKPKSHQETLVSFDKFFVSFFFANHVLYNRLHPIKQLCMQPSPCQHCIGVYGVPSAWK